MAVSIESWDRDQEDRLTLGWSQWCLLDVQLQHLREKHGEMLGRGAEVTRYIPCIYYGIRAVRSPVRPWGTIQLPLHNGSARSPMRLRAAALREPA